jgi:UDP-glucose 4-epimerase
LNLADSKLVVIGGGGLIGSHTVDALTRTDAGEIVVYDTFQRGTRENLADALRDPRVRVFEHGGDITRPDLLKAALDGADGVFHFAALWLLHCQEFPRAAFDVNVAGTFNVIEACAAAGVQRLVFSSSASVYGDAVEEPMTEDHPFNYENFYGATKVAGEALARGMFKLAGVPYVALRYMNVYGPRQDYSGAYIAVIMRMLDSIDRDEPLTIFGDGSQAYDFVYVGDCAEANVCAMRADTVDRTYNVGTSTRTSIADLADLVLRITGSDVGVQTLPEGVTFVKNRIGSTERARDEIGFEARVDFEDGLRALIEWRRSHKDELRQRQDRALTQ